MPAGGIAQVANSFYREPAVSPCSWRSVKCCTLFFSFFRLQVVLDPGRIGMHHADGATVALIGWPSARTSCHLFADKTWQIVVEAQIDPAAFPDRLKVAVFQGAAAWQIDVFTLLAEAQAEQVNATLDGFDAAIQAWHAAHGTERAKLLDIGGRARSGGVQRSSLYPGCDVTVLDIIPGPDVDVVADAHQMSRHLPAGHFDFALSVAVFEHLAMPWKAAVEMARVLKHGGLALVSTHQTIGLHDTPWDFFRFSDAAFTALFNRATGFEIVTTGMLSFLHVVPRVWMERHRGWEETGGFEESSVLVRKVAEPLVDWDVKVSDFLATTYPDEQAVPTPPRLVSELTKVFSRGTRPVPEVQPVVRIAERFVSPVGALQRLDMPDDLRGIAPGQELDAVVMDESGNHCRRARIAPPPSGRAGTRIEFDAIPILPQARLWFFVIEADYGDGTAALALIDILLQHGRKLEQRAPINLIWDADPVASPDAAAQATGGRYGTR
jgi:SAM-dependent methyltransferase